MGQLRDRMEEDLRLKGYSPSTRRNYLLYCRKFAAHYRRPPQGLGEEDIRQFLLHQIPVEQLSYDTYRQVLSALKFLYTVTLGRPWTVERIPFPKYRQRPLPDVPHADDLTALFSALHSLKYRALLMTCYAAGLRISEACQLRVSTSIRVAWSSAFARAKAARNATPSCRRACWRCCGAIGVWTSRATGCSPGRRQPVMSVPIPSGSCSAGRGIRPDSIAA
jgi:site-specific recombinase XerD